MAINEGGLPEQSLLDNTYPSPARQKAKNCSPSPYSFSRAKRSGDLPPHLVHVPQKQVVIGKAERGASLPSALPEAGSTEHLPGGAGWPRRELFSTSHPQKQASGLCIPAGGVSVESRGTVSFHLT